MVARFEQFLFKPLSIRNVSCNPLDSYHPTFPDDWTFIDFKQDHTAIGMNDLAGIGGSRCSAAKCLLAKRSDHLVYGIGSEELAIDILPFFHGMAGDFQYGR